MKRYLQNGSKYFICWLVVLTVLLAITFCFAMPAITKTLESEWTKYNFMFVKHRGVPHHGLMHSMGRGGSGFCPQLRATVKAPDELYNQSNPLPASQKNIDAGMALYQIGAQPTACKICHGANGNGLGMMANGLIPKPRNFTCVETMEAITDGQMFWVIKNGSPGTGMIPYKGLSEDQIWQLILYLRKFAEKK